MLAWIYLELLRDGGLDSTAPVRVTCDFGLWMEDFKGYGSIPARPQILTAAEDARHRILPLYTLHLLRYVQLYPTVRPRLRELSSAVVGMKHFDMHR